jgi:hypothetical protein
MKKYTCKILCRFIINIIFSANCGDVNTKIYTDLISEYTIFIKDPHNLPNNEKKIRELFYYIYNQIEIKNTEENDEQKKLNNIKNAMNKFYTNLHKACFPCNNTIINIELSQKLDNLYTSLSKSNSIKNINDILINTLPLCPNQYFFDLDDFYKIGKIYAQIHILKNNDKKKIIEKKILFLFDNQNNINNFKNNDFKVIKNLYNRFFNQYLFVYKEYNLLINIFQKSLEKKMNDNKYIGNEIEYFYSGFRAFHGENLCTIYNFYKRLLKNINLIHDKKIEIAKEHLSLENIYIKTISNQKFILPNSQKMNTLEENITSYIYCNNEDIEKKSNIINTFESNIKEIEQQLQQSNLTRRDLLEKSSLIASSFQKNKKIQKLLFAQKSKEIQKPLSMQTFFSLLGLTLYTIGVEKLLQQPIHK